MDKKTIKRNKIIALAIFLAVGILLVIYNVSWPCTKTIDGTMIKVDDRSVQVPVEVRLEGRYQLNCFADDAFEGKVSIVNMEGMDFEDEFYLDAKEGYSIGRTGEDDGSAGDAKNWLHIFSGRFFRDIWIGVPDEEGSMRTDNGLCIVTEEWMKEAVYNRELSL